MRQAKSRIVHILHLSILILIAQLLAACFQPIVGERTASVEMVFPVPGIRSSLSGYENPGLTVVIAEETLLFESGSSAHRRRIADIAAGNADLHAPLPDSSRYAEREVGTASSGVSVSLSGLMPDRDYLVLAVASDGAGSFHALHADYRRVRMQAGSNAVSLRLSDNREAVLNDFQSSYGIYPLRLRTLGMLASFEGDGTAVFISVQEWLEPFFAEPNGSDDIVVDNVDLVYFLLDIPDPDNPQGVYEFFAGNQGENTIERLLVFVDSEWLFEDNDDGEPLGYSAYYQTDDGGEIGTTPPPVNIETASLTISSQEQSGYLFEWQFETEDAAVRRGSFRGTVDYTVD